MKLWWITSRTRTQIRLWSIPALYILLAIVLALTIQQFSLPAASEDVFQFETATAVLSAISSGMIAFTGFGFSLIFVLIQSGNATYSPRLSSYFLQDGVVRHALGIFIATFIYALLTLASVDALMAAHVLDVAVFLVLACLIASMIMFLAIFQRFSLLQVNNILRMIGDMGRKAIQHTYHKPCAADDAAAETVVLPDDMHLLKTIYYHGAPLAIREVNHVRLLALAQKIDGVVEMDYGVGDMVANDAPFIRLRGRQEIKRRVNLKRLVLFDHQRTIEDDPKYALRLIVDIAIRSLSPGVNDPSTAVQALDQIDDLLCRLVRFQLGQDFLTDAEGRVRVLLPSAGWEDYLALGLDEIRLYGAASVQVMRRMNALLSDLKDAAPACRKASIIAYHQRLQAAILQKFSDADDLASAQKADRQGIGLWRQLIDDDQNSPH